jgi:hypothetical protein
VLKEKKNDILTLKHTLQEKSYGGQWDYRNFNETLSNVYKRKIIFKSREKYVRSGAWSLETVFR